jgi:hypothetical protein
MDSSNIIVCNSETEPDSKCTLLIGEEESSSDECFASSTLLLYKEVSDGEYELYSSERVYMPLENYCINNLDKGNYYYVIRSDYPTGGFADEIEGGYSEIRIAKPFALETESAVKAEDIIVRISNPSISVYDSGEYHCIMAAESPDSDVTVASFVHAVYEDETTPIDLSLNTITGSDFEIYTVDFSNLTNKASGTYNITVGYTVSYKDYEKSITSDPIPYVKH